MSACDCCGGYHPYQMSSGFKRLEFCLRVLNDRLREVEAEHLQPSPPPSQQRPEPKAGQVWRDDDAARFCLLTHRHQGSRWSNVDLTDGSNAIDDPIEQCWTYVCDGAIPASEKQS